MGLREHLYRFEVYPPSVKFVTYALPFPEPRIVFDGHQSIPDCPVLGLATAPLLNGQGPSCLHAAASRRPGRSTCSPPASSWRIATAPRSPTSISRMTPAGARRRAC